MVVGVLVVAAVFGVVSLTLLLIFRRDLVGVDLGARSLLRLYLYLASLAGLLVVSVGVSALLDAGAAGLVDPDTVYGHTPSGGPYAMPNVFLRQQDDVLRGVTLIAFGLVFWGGHRFARSRVERPEERGSALRRAHDVLSMFVFGVGTVVLLPVGIYQMLSTALIATPLEVYRPGFADSLSGGIASAPLWLMYLLRVVRTVGEESARSAPGRSAPIPIGIA